MKRSIDRWRGLGHWALVIAGVALPILLWQRQALRQQESAWMSALERCRQFRSDLAAEENLKIVLREKKRSVQAQWQQASNVASSTSATATLSAIPATPVEPPRLEPPAAWPFWEPDSAFVWMRKEDMARLPIPTFDDHGSMKPEAEASLALTATEKRQLDEELPAILNELHALELMHAEVLPVSNPEAFEAEPKLTLVVDPFPEEAARLQEMFQATLERVLGRQRAELLSAMGHSWLRETFNISNSEPTSYTVMRHADGSFNVTVRGPGRYKSVGGHLQLDRHIPNHLLPAFADLIEGKVK